MKIDTLLPSELRQIASVKKLASDSTFLRQNASTQALKDELERRGFRVEVSGREMDGDEDEHEEEHEDIKPLFERQLEATVIMLQRGCPDEALRELPELLPIDEVGTLGDIKLFIQQGQFDDALLEIGKLLHPKFKSPDHAQVAYKRSMEEDFDE